MCAGRVGLRSKPKFGPTELSILLFIKAEFFHIFYACVMRLHPFMRSLLAKSVLLAGMGGLWGTEADP